MMIGGEDTVVIGAPLEGEGEFILSRLRAQWTDAVVERDSSDSAQEFFVYRTQEDHEAWQKDGCADENKDSMIHVILGEHSTTIVSADPGSRTHEFASKLYNDVMARRAAMREDKFWWHGSKCTVDDVLERTASMTSSEVSQAITEMSGVMSRLDFFCRQRTTDPEERDQAQRVVALVAEKRRMTKNVVAKMHVAAEADNNGRLDRLEDLLDTVDQMSADNPAAALRTLTAALRTYWKLGKVPEAPAPEAPEAAGRPARSKRPQKITPPEVIVRRR